MSSLRTTVALLLVAGALSLSACGGKSSGNSSNGAGSAGSGSTPSQPRGCTYGGKDYADGDSFQSTDDCNSCSCNDGSVACTEIGCDPGPGPTLPISCDQVGAFYDQLLDDAKSCDPHETEPCNFRVKSQLGCGCDTYVNPKYWNRDLATAYASHSQALSCAVDCGVCTQAPLRGKCTLQSRCEDTNEPRGGPGCKVDGVVYADGSTGIPDPVSCNLCSCSAGQLACDEKACPRPCPAGTKLAQSCAQCGPTDACEVVEHSCRPVCTDTCANGECINGACLNGVCG